MVLVMKIESSDVYVMLYLSSSKDSESLSVTPAVLDSSGVQVAVADVSVDHIQISMDASKGVDHLEEAYDTLLNASVMHFHWF